MNLIKQVLRVHNRNATILKFSWVNKYNWKILGRNILYGTTTATFIMKVRKCHLFDQSDYQFFKDFSGSNKFTKPNKHFIATVW